MDRSSKHQQRGGEKQGGRMVNTIIWGGGGGEWKMSADLNYSKGKDRSPEADMK